MNEEEYINVLWEQFGIETAEHLENLENLLIELEYREVESEELSALFRAFHTVKGLSKSMELLAMEAVAHRSEDILGLVRDEGAPLSADTINILLEAIGILQTFRTTAVQDRADSEKPLELIQKLETVFSQLAQDLDDPPTQAALNPAAADEVPPAENISTQSTEDSATEIPSQPLPSLTQDIDPEILEFFAETVRNSLPSVAKIAVQTQFGPEDEETINILDTLAFASENMELFLLSETFELLKSIAEQTEALSEDAQHELRYALGRLPQMLLTLAEDTQLDFGQEQFLQDIPTELHQQFISKLEQAKQQVTELLGTFERDDSTPEQISTICTQSKSLQSYAQLLGNKHVTDLIVAVIDIYQRTGDALKSSGEGLSLNIELIQLSQNSFELCSQLTENQLNQGDKIFDEEVQKHFQQIQNNVMGESVQSEASSDIINALKEKGLHEEYFSLFTDEIFQQIRQQIEQNNRLYILRSPADMDEETAAKFIVWLQSGVEIFTSRSIVLQTTSDIEFFFAATADPDSLQAELKEMDGGKGILKLAELGSQAAAQINTPAKVDTPNETSTSAAEKSAEEPEPEATKVDARKSAAVSNKAPPPPAATRGADKEQNMIRVNGAVLDQFMDQIGEMVLIRSQLNHLLHDENINSIYHQLKLAISQLKNKFDANDDSHDQLESFIDSIFEHNHNLVQVDMQIQSTLNQLQEEVMELRVVPIENVFKRFPRVVRDLAKSQGKKVQFEMQGGDVRIDKGMVDLLVDPLMHMIRNSVDHGVEIPEQRQEVGKTPQAKLLLKANQRGNQVIIDIIDDGKGIDPLKIRQKIIDRELLSAQECEQLADSEVYGYIFEAGFSTAEKLTETSGRGVGLDVVKTVVNKLGGKIKLDSKLNEGTQFSMEFPLSAAIQNTLLVEVNQQVFAIPDRYVAEVIETPPESVQSIKGCKAILLRQVFLPIVYLGELLSRNPLTREREQDLPVVVLSNGYHRLGLEVDKLYHRQELFIKELNPQLAALPGVGGASILGNGRVVLILDGEDLFTLGSQINSSSHKAQSQNIDRVANQ